MQPIHYTEMTVSFLLLLIQKRLGFTVYQVLLTVAYLLILIFDPVLDITLAVYFFFAVIPFLPHIKSISTLNIVTLAIIGFQILIGLLAYDTYRTLSMLIVRCSWLIVLLFFERYPFPPLSSKSTFNMIISLFLFETLISILTLQFVENSQRLMLNFQCPSGCLAVTGILLCGYYFHIEKGNRHRSLVNLLMAGFVFWAIRSATRGYILIAVVMAMVIFLLFVNKKLMVVIIPLFSFVLLIIVVLKPDLLKVIIDQMRIGESTGIRPLENRFILEMFFRGSITNKLFGYGIGNAAYNHIVAYEAASITTSEYYIYFKLLNLDYSHNFWGGLLYSMGLVGLISVIVFIINLLKRINRDVKNFRFRIVLIAYILVYCVMLLFRWTATSGLLEMFLFLVILNSVKENSIHP